MTPADLSLEQRYYGGEEHRPPAKTALRAGAFRGYYEAGNLRYLRAGQDEAIRMIYSAARDHNWNTVVPRIRDEKIAVGEHEFSITYEAHYQEDDIDFQAQYSIEGSADGMIVFEMVGTALSAFRKNRIGFCVLHPAQVAGQPCTIFTTDRQEKAGRFPIIISPHQPFMNLAAIQWPSGGNRYRLEFEGDVFETEDQRNWTDASFKTYCTPLAEPFPVALQPGEKVHQKIVLKLLDADTIQEVVNDKISLRLTGERSAFPAIGIAQASAYEPLTEEETHRLQNIGFSHYRVEVRWHESDYQAQWNRAVEESSQLQLPLELVMYFGSEEKEVLSRIETLQQQHPANVRYLLLFQQGEKVTSDKLLTHWVPPLRKLFPQAEIGAGTDCFFTELNRQRVATEHLDFISYSINPQVHHFDNQSLVETLATQAETVRSARQYFNDPAVHISPVTLKMRFNPNATAPSSGTTPAERLAQRTDTRQMSLLGAGWTLGSIKYLSEAKVGAITYYEMVGSCGIMGSKVVSQQHPLFANLAGKLFPVYWVLYHVLDETQQQILHTQSSHPLQIDGLVVERENHTLIMLANWQAEAVEVSLPDFLGVRKRKSLTRHNFMELADGTWADSHWEEESGSCRLDAYDIAILRVETQ